MCSFPDTGLYGLALWRIAAKAKAGMEVGLKKDKHWEKDASAASGLVPVYEYERSIYSPFGYPFSNKIFLLTARCDFSLKLLLIFISSL